MDGKLIVVMMPATQSKSLISRASESPAPSPSLSTCHVT